MNEAEYLMKNYGNRGGCYPSRPWDEADNTLDSEISIYNSSYEELYMGLYVCCCCIRLHTTANTNATTPDIVGPAKLGLVASVCTKL